MSLLLLTGLCNMHILRNKIYLVKVVKINVWLVDFPSIRHSVTIACKMKNVMSLCVTQFLLSPYFNEMFLVGVGIHSLNETKVYIYIKVYELHRIVTIM